MKTSAKYFGLAVGS